MISNPIFGLVVGPDHFRFWCTFLLAFTVVPFDYTIGKLAKGFLKIPGPFTMVLSYDSDARFDVSDPATVLMLVSVLSTGTCSTEPLDPEILLGP